jgi:hypothetical protein
VLWLDFLSLAPDSGGSSGSGAPVPPVSVTRTLYAGTKIQILWIAGDASATTRLYDNAGAFLGEFPAGIVAWNSGLTTLSPVSATHKKNGIESSKTSEA